MALKAAMETVTSSVGRSLEKFRLHFVLSILVSLCRGVETNRVQLISSLLHHYLLRKVKFLWIQTRIECYELLRTYLPHYLAPIIYCAGVSPSSTTDEISPYAHSYDAWTRHYNTNKALYESFTELGYAGDIGAIEYDWLVDLLLSRQYKNDR